MRKATMVTFLAGLLASTAALAERMSWQEDFMGMGAGSSESSACSSAKNMARSNAAIACMARSGHKLGDDFEACDCTSVEIVEGYPQWSCTVELEVECESNRDQ